MKFSVIGSGSKGNVTYLETNNTKILIDCGLTFKQINVRLKSHDLNLENLDGIFITHEHTDHVAGLNVLMNKLDTTIYMTKITYDSLKYKIKENIPESKMSFITPYEKQVINDCEILPFSISHDASDAVGYVIYAEGKKMVYITDTGYLPIKDFELLEKADAYIFESNYDVTMLFTSDRPFYLKQRIDSVKGHLSNNDSAYNMVKLVGENTKQIVLAHPSRECNTAAAAIETYNEVFNDYGLKISDYNLVVATQDIPTKIFEI